MTAVVRDATAERTITAISARDNAGTLRTIKEGWIRTAAGLKEFFGQLAVALSRYSVFATRNSAGTVTITSGTVTATPSGGVAPFSYAWSRTSPDAHSWTIDSPNSASTTFSTTAGQGGEYVATFICTVTDATGASAASPAVTVDAANNYFGGGGGGGGGVYP